MNNEEIRNALDDAKNLLDSVYCHYEKNGESWILNHLTTIDLLIKEVMKGE